MLFKNRSLQNIVFSLPTAVELDFYNLSMWGPVFSYKLYDPGPVSYSL